MRAFVGWGWWWWTLTVGAAAQGLVDPGDVLVGVYGCVSCHAVSAPVPSEWVPLAAPDLRDVGSRVTPSYLRRFLISPASTREGTLMPDLLAALPEDLRADAAENLAHYLTSLGGPMETAPVGGTLEDVERGRRLFHGVGCFACHGPMEPPWQLAYPVWELDQIPDVERRFHEQEAEPYVQPGTLPYRPYRLDHLPQKTSVGALERFLLDPHAARPSGRMPSLRLQPEEAGAIARYLLRSLASDGGGRVKGVQYELFAVKNDASAPALDGLEPSERGHLPTFTLPAGVEDMFGVRYRGFVDIPSTGSWTFFTTSDDGSRLWVDGRLVVVNDGKHPMVERKGTIDLESGSHPIEVTFYEYDGGQGLEVRWEGPGVDKQIIPSEALWFRSLGFAPLDAAPIRANPARVDAGRKLFGDLGCASCHDAGDAIRPVKAGPPFLALPDAGEAGCLAPHPTDHAVPTSGAPTSHAPASDPGPSHAPAPRFSFQGDDRASLLGAVSRAKTARAARSFAAIAEATMRRFDCYACHRRDGIGGPHPLLQDLFQLEVELDVGDTGRLPPDLGAVGRKLQRPWLEGALLGDRRAHQHMRTRMPAFGAEHVAHLVEAFAAADQRDSAPAAPEFDVERAEVGRQLAGTDALGCIRCHTFDGRPSLGVPAVDMMLLGSRLQYPYFRDLLLDPAAVEQGSRMPDFWVDGRSPVRDVAGGDPVQQIDALWTYLALGTSMPVPKGLVTPAGTYELMPDERPQLVGVFMKDVGPRTVLVGYPQRVHVAFDVERGRLAKVWRGRFFDAEGTWHARAGRLEEPHGKDVLDQPTGPAWACLESREAPWPAGATGVRARGRRMLADGTPVFRYQVGEVTIEEWATPRLDAGGPGLRREFSVTSDQGPGEVYVRLAVAASIRRRPDGRFDVSGRISSTIGVPDGIPVLLRPVGAVTELVLAVPLPEPGGRRRLTVDLWW